MAWRPKNGWPKVTRDGVLFTAGLVGVIHETLREEITERPLLLLTFTTMMGLPVFLRRDEKKANGNGNGAPPPPIEPPGEVE